MPCKALILASVSGFVAVCEIAGLAALTSDRPLLQGEVLAVQNGQELLVRLGSEADTVRLACVQAPRPQQEPHADKARQHLKSLLEDDPDVTLELRGRDVFGRMVAVVRRDGEDLAAQLLSAGLIFAHDGFVGRCDDLKYDGLQNQARASRLGIWSQDPDGIERPWDLIERDGGGQPP